MEAMMQVVEMCEGCGHTIGEHFNDVRGIARCLHVDSGVSDRGIIGIPWSSRCDCVNFHSAQTNMRREEEARKEAERDRAMNAILEEMKRRKELVADPCEPPP